MRKPIAPIAPREKMTKKARAAIAKYVLLKLEGASYVGWTMAYTLQAERMSRKRLYAWLVDRGYRWNSKKGVWVK